MDKNVARGMILFEKFMKETAFPAVDDISTRATRYKAKYLLVDAEDKELNALDNDQMKNFSIMKK